jgi:hypothetical protein
MINRNNQLTVKGADIRIITGKQQDYISLTDIARYKKKERTDDLIRNWIRNRNTVEFIGIWEQLNNPDFNTVEFDGFRKKAGLNSFALTPKQWIENSQHAIGKNSSQALLQPEKSFGKQAVAQLTQIPWGCNIAIISKCKNLDEALFCVQKTFKNGIVHGCSNACERNKTTKLDFNYGEFATIKGG